MRRCLYQAPGLHGGTPPTAAAQRAVRALHRWQPNPPHAGTPPPCSALTDLVLPVALTALPDMVPGQLARLASLDLTHSIVEALPPSWCCNMQVRQAAHPPAGCSTRRGFAASATCPPGLGAA